MALVNIYEAPTLRQQINSLPAHIVDTCRSRYANEGTNLEARAIIDREAATTALAVWMRLADVAGRMREPPLALVAAAALAGPAGSIRTQGFEARSNAEPAA